MVRLLDLSHTVTAGMVTYKGLPGPVIGNHLTREASRPLHEGGTTFQIGKIEMVANTGTYVDAPAFDGLDLAGKAVLVATGWDRFWRTPRYHERSPHLTRSAAERLVAEGAAIVGIDSHNIDDTDDKARPVHSILLRAGIPIVEHLTRLTELPPDGFRFFAVPVKVAGMGTFPVRAFAEIRE